MGDPPPHWMLRLKFRRLLILAAFSPDPAKALDRRNPYGWWSQRHTRPSRDLPDNHIG